MKVPKGYTEEQVVEIIMQISLKLANKFRFGYHEIDDMRQQVFLEILKPDKNGITILEKFDTEKGNSLDSFLWIHARNRLHNFKRDNYARPELPCTSCPLKAYIDGKCQAFSEIKECEYYFRWLNRNETKKNLASNQGTDAKTDVYYNVSMEEKLFSKEIFRIVDKNIPISLREDWIRFFNKLKLSKQKRTVLLEKVIEILKENGIEQEKR